MQVNASALRETTAALAGCLSANVPGLACPLAQGLVTRTGPPDAARYVGVLPAVVSGPPDAPQWSVKDAERFVWAFLAVRTASGPPRPPASGTHDGWASGSGFEAKMGVVASPAGQCRLQSWVKRVCRGSDLVRPSLQLKAGRCGIDLQIICLTIVLSRCGMLPGEAGACDPTSRPCAEGDLCVGWQPGAPGGSASGRCLRATARYLPSFSTALSCEVCPDSLILQTLHQSHLGP